MNNNQEKNPTQGLKNDQNKLPLGTVIQKQFPNAIEAIAKCSEFGHKKYSESDNDWLNYQRIDDAMFRYTNATIRHFFAEGGDNDKIDKDSSLPHIYQTAWNAIARLEVYLKNKKENETIS